MTAGARERESDAYGASQLPSERKLLVRVMVSCTHTIIFMSSTLHDSNNVPEAEIGTVTLHLCDFILVVLSPASVIAA